MNERLAQYSEMTLDQLLQDEWLVRSARHPNAETEAFWKLFADQHPEKAATVQQSLQLAGALRFARDLPPEGSMDRVWQQVISQAGAGAPIVPLYRKAWFRISGVAAAVLVMIAAWILVDRKGDAKPQTVASAYGEQKNVQLPDNSQVTLNGNSYIKFSKQWGKDQKREVWIDGEAFLQVQHTAKGQTASNESDRFIVHLKDLDVEVLGTKFNVKQRRDEMNVMLKEGSVQIVLTESGQVVKMEPGESITYQKNGTLLRQQIEAGFIDSWTQKRLHFYNTPLPEVIGMLEDTYGLKVKVENKNLLQRTLSGNVTATDEDVLLKALELLMNAHVSKQGNEVTIR